MQRFWDRSARDFLRRSQPLSSPSLLSRARGSVEPIEGGQRLVVVPFGSPMDVRSQKVELKHVPRWQMSLASRPAGVAVRALAWLGPERAEDALSSIKRKLPPRGVQRACCCSTPVSDLARTKRRKGSAWLIISSSSYPRTSERFSQLRQIDRSARPLARKGRLGRLGASNTLHHGAR